MKREKDLAKNTLILSIGTVLPKAVNFVTLPILTMYLTKAEYGTYDLFNTLVSLLLPVVTLQIQAAAFRFLIECREDKEGQRSIITNVYVFTVMVSLLSLAAFFFAMRGIPLLSRLIVCIYFFLDILLNTSRQVLRGLGRNRVYSVSCVLNSLVGLVCIFFFVQIRGWGLNGVLAALCFSLFAALACIFHVTDIFSYIQFSLTDKKVVKRMLGYSWPMLPNSLSEWVMRLSDRLVITGFLGVEANAVYAVANKLPVLYGILQGTFTQAWTENASIVSRDQDTDRYYSEMFDTMYGVFAGIMSSLIALTPVLFGILFKGDYTEAYYQMPLLYVGAFFSSLSAYLGGIYVAHMQTKKVGMSTALAAGCNLLIDLALINRIGIYAGAISTLASYFFLVAYRIVDVRRIQKMSFKYGKMAAILMVLAGMGALCYLRRPWSNIMNAVIAVFMVVALNWKIIVAIYRLVWQRVSSEGKSRP